MSKQTINLMEMLNQKRAQLLNTEYLSTPTFSVTSTSAEQLMSPLTAELLLTENRFYIINADGNRCSEEISVENLSQRLPELLTQNLRLKRTMYPFLTTIAGMINEVRQRGYRVYAQNYQFDSNWRVTNLNLLKEELVGNETTSPFELFNRIENECNAVLINDNNETVLVKTDDEPRDTNELQMFKIVDKDQEVIIENVTLSKLILVLYALLLGSDAHFIKHAFLFPRQELFHPLQYNRLDYVSYKSSPVYEITSYDTLFRSKNLVVEKQQPLLQGFYYLSDYSVVNNYELPITSNDLFSMLSSFNAPICSEQAHLLSKRIVELAENYGLILSYRDRECKGLFTIEDINVRENGGLDILRQSMDKDFLEEWLSHAVIERDYSLCDKETGRYLTVEENIFQLMNDLMHHVGQHPTAS